MDADISPLVGFWAERSYKVKAAFVLSFDWTKLDGDYKGDYAKLTVTVTLAPEDSTKYHSHNSTEYQVVFKALPPYVTGDAHIQLQSLVVEFADATETLERVKKVLAVWQCKQAKEHDIEDELRVAATASAIQQLPRGQQMLAIVSDGFEARYMSDMPSYD